MGRRYSDLDDLMDEIPAQAADLPYSRDAAKGAAGVVLRAVCTPAELAAPGPDIPADARLVARPVLRDVLEHLGLLNPAAEE